ncbi:hypothetical protein INR49_028448 [Caranx melampygus]|nr:hypothetical protein INR49_028448 [Caranx melampygus]
MTRKLQDPGVDEARSRKRRLQNPKLEKAEILDLAVEYLQKWTDGKKPTSDSTKTKSHAPVMSLHLPEATPPPPLFSIQSAGFQQCVAQLSSYMNRITPAQRMSLIEGLKHHADTQQPKTDVSQRTTETERPEAASADGVCTSERKDEFSKSLFPSISPFQPPSCSTPRHEHLTPPTSPWFSPSFSTYATSPPFPSLASHFSFPPSLSPPSSNTSFYSLSPTFPHTSPPALHLPQSLP